MRIRSHPPERAARGAPHIFSANPFFLGASEGLAMRVVDPVPVLLLFWGWLEVLSFEAGLRFVGGVQ